MTQSTYSSKCLSSTTQRESLLRMHLSIPTSMLSSLTELRRGSSASKANACAMLKEKRAATLTQFRHKLRQVLEVT